MLDSNLAMPSAGNRSYEPVPCGLVDELRGKSFLAPHSLSPAAFADLIDFAIRLKRREVEVGKPLDGKTVALVFFNQSLRTRSSMSVAVHQLGGLPLSLDVGGGVWNVEFADRAIMDGDKAEHIREMAPVVGSYADLCAVRCFPQLQSYEADSAEQALNAFVRLSGKPVINLESSLHHPCQGLADLMSIREQFGSLRGRKLVLTWAYHPKALPLAVPNSFVSAAAMSGANLTISHPPGFELAESLLGAARIHAASLGGSIQVLNERSMVPADAEVIYVKSWTSTVNYGDADADRDQRSKHKDWVFDARAFEMTPKAHFMHCLPVRRNVEVADEVLDSPRSLVLLQAENRLHAQKALLVAMAKASEMDS
jgi:N-acetylornithine carbamoyltransferase